MYWKHTMVYNTIKQLIDNTILQNRCHSFNTYINHRKMDIEKQGFQCLLGSHASLGNKLSISVFTSG